jgi:two-component system, cell cycle sensor histidine kinase and response regulator CckA
MRRDHASDILRTQTTVNKPSSADEQIARLTAALEAARERAVRTETAFEQQREFLEQAQQVAHIGSWVAELDGSDRLIWSREMYRILGHPAGDELTRTRAMATFVHPDDREALRVAREAAIAADRPFDIEHRVVQANGAVRWVHTLANLVRAADGTPLRMVGTLQDITDRRALEDELRQAQKLDAIGRLAGGVSHDLNNALTIIIGYAELAASALSEGDPVRADVREIQRAAERAESVTRQLLAFSRKQWLEPRIFQLSDAVQDLGRMLDRLVGPRIELVTSVDSDLPAIYGDRGQIEQAIINLAVNACDAMPAGGGITIRAAVVDIDATFARARQPMTPGRYVDLSVADSGSGITPEVRAHMFEPFFTTKELGRGTGLGLAMVYGTVKQSRGFIFVESELGKGATFHLYFPPARSQRTRLTGPHTAAAAHGVTILVVEDEPGVRGLVISALNKEGFRVLQADSGKSALAVAAEAGRIDVLLTDFMMPGMTGLELVASLAATQENLGVVVMSGHPQQLIALPQLRRPAEFLPKPFTPNELRQRLYAVLSNDTDQLK